jgi:hypothetical protein
MKSTLLAAMTVAGGTVFTSCGMTDIRHNVVAGTMSFVEGYTTDMFYALFPPAGELIDVGSGD